MLRARCLFPQSFAIVAAILFAASVVAVTAVGQTAPSKPAAECSAYTSIPLPAEAKDAPFPKTAPDCGSYRSYRGLGRPVNYATARTCAWQERLAQQASLGQSAKEPISWVVGGSLILADIYFNGAGVKRNIPLAMRFACESEEEMAKLALPEIAKLEGSPRARGPFEFCNYAATTFTMNFCSVYASQIDDERRNRYYESLKSSMNEQQRTAFEKLLAAEDAYIEAHASEVDQEGTIRAMQTIGSQRILKDLFRMQLAHFERGKWPALSDRQIATADALLDREYRRKLQHLGSHTRGELDQGTVTPGHLSSVQEMWLAYRDAWIAFARLRYPSAVAAIRTEITLARYRLVKTIE